MAADLRPGEDHLRGRHRLALRLRQPLGDGLDFGGVDQQGQAEQVVAEGRVRRDQDVLLRGVLDEFRLGETWVAFYLVGGGDDASVLDDGLELEGV